jgi:tryptophanyl-tRNA synthetase
MEQKKIILSGVTPSGALTIGHVTGALSNWKKLQNEYDSYFMVADQHAITVKQVPKDLRQRTIDTAAFFIAAGIDPEQSTLFIQSHVPAHAMLTWVLTTFTGMGECQRMTQFKDKSKNQENVNVGLFSYPILMAVDILLYQADLVPVGEDQKQHLELTRNLAQRFNHNYSETFTSPEPYIPKVGGRIMSLQDPTTKMSKSDPNVNATIFLDDSDDDIKRKIKRAVTDSGTDIVYDEKRPGISNLIELYSIAKEISIDETVKHFDGAGYGDFKAAVGDAVADFIFPIREKFFEVKADKKRLNEILQLGKEKASKKAFKTLNKVYKKVGFYQF